VRGVELRDFEKPLVIKSYGRLESALFLVEREEDFICLRNDNPFEAG